MKILVTGANGLLGQKLVSLLQEKGNIHVVATARGKSAQPITQGEFRSLDVTDNNQVEKLVSETKPDVIIHTAAMTQVDDCETKRDECILNNVTAVEHLVAACRAHNIHLVHVSTDFIFDGSTGPLDELAEPNPVNFYGESKLAAEKAIQSSGISWSILRTVLVYGVTNDMSRSNIVLWVKKSLEEKKTISVVNDQWRTPTLAEDLAQGCYLAAIKKAQGVFNISGKDFMSPFDIAVQTAKFFKLDASLIQATDSTKFKQPARRPMKTGFIIDKAKKELGYEPHSFLEGLEVLSKQISS
ncbi:MAG TPA: SDR family oxidoreductase [Cyclobacteriaceae bacterium]|nr:SDR family oxidoreductase [Cyclobacteriaceae bacterium]HMV10419.1 SDR family oxidoreductase [Cyclobacteriaceae bacterium]HMV90429.1 SDR family oxidoreductase [Cyclobacteriaceae bacterium]HMX01342.1 SDR family oxidoreductase [Cyclobacteriaceae bacterium]HMX50387.1 SDR family oxidoreductase [Cyclobacteriaceae bacterium]